MANYVKLTVIGGSSPATPVLLLVLGRAIAAGLLPPMSVSLWGRNQHRLSRIRDYVAQAGSAPAAAQDTARGGLEITCHASLHDALQDTAYILCQIRPGGMDARALDENIALDAGLPGDEGIGPGGLAAFLRGRPAMTRILDECAGAAPAATFLQMTSPLSLMTKLVSDYYPHSGFGLCELPTTTLRRILQHTEARVGHGPLRPALAGLNHRSWLYDFRDCDDVDRTADVLAAIVDYDLVKVDPDVIRDFGAIPMHYLSLFLHTDRHVQRQQRATHSRGEELSHWSAQLHNAYCSASSVDHARVTELLQQRKIDWYEDGVANVLQAFTAAGTTRVPLNLLNQGCIPDLPDDAIVETYCDITDGVVTRSAAPKLPPLAAQLTKDLASYEHAVLALPCSPSTAEIGAALNRHPLCRSGDFTALSQAISHATRTTS